MTYQHVISHLQKLADPAIASNSAKYFKSQFGEYGFGDFFLGIRVPVLRRCVRQYQDLGLTHIKKLLTSEYHEARLFSLLLMVKQFSKSDEAIKAKIYSLYITHTKYINNWDLVDSSAPYIVGAWLLDKERELLYQFASSPNLWKRRISMLSTANFIKNNQFDDTFNIATLLLNDPHDLIHKAVGWMLREVGNRDREAEEKYLKQNYKAMPRTMLRYAIEKFEPAKRQLYLTGHI